MTDRSQFGKRRSLRLGKIDTLSKEHNQALTSLDIASARKVLGAHGSLDDQMMTRRDRTPVLPDGELPE